MKLLAPGLHKYRVVVAATPRRPRSGPRGKWAEASTTGQEVEEEEKKKMKYPYRVSCQNSLRPTFSVYWFVGHNLWRKLHAAPWPLLFFFNKWTVLVSKKKNQGFLQGLAQVGRMVFDAENQEKLN